MSYFVLSPCLLKNKAKEYCDSMKLLEIFATTIGFIKENLKIQLLIHKNSIYCNLYAYTPPLNNVNVANFFQANIAKTLAELINVGEFVDFDSYKTWNCDPSYTCVDKVEVNQICDSVARVKGDVVMFVGCDNYGCSDEIKFFNDTHNVNFCIVKDVYTDLTGNYDSYIKFNFDDSIFPNKDMCGKLCNDISHKRDTALYHIYGEVVSKRNGYYKLGYDSRWFKANAPHFCRKDNKYVIVLDDVHGTFEVFDNLTKEKTYIGEYKLNGEKVENKSSKIETHKYYG